jgi:hypothetical protein
MSVMSSGLMVGSDVLFYRITHDERYLDRAERTANATLDHFPPDWMWKQLPVEVAVLFRNLFAVDALRPNPRYRAALEAYLDRALAEAYEPATGLFDRNAGHGGVALHNPNEGFSVLEQAPLVQMFTLLAWPRDRLGMLH